MRTPTSSPTSAQRASAAIALGFLGMLGGTWIGSKVQGDCACDDPGLKGALIGMPIGTVVGAVVGITIMVVQRKGRHTQIPFGPYLAGAGMLAMLFGEQISAVLRGVTGG